jgi:hypothetical protein
MPPRPADATASASLNLRLLRGLQSIVDGDPEISRGVLKFAAAEEERGDAEAACGPSLRVTGAAQAVFKVVVDVLPAQPTSNPGT